MTSNGGENQNEDIFVGELIYPDAVNGKTYGLFAHIMPTTMFMKKRKRHRCLQIRTIAIRTTR